MNFFELAWNNVRKKFSSYMIYLVSTVFAVTIFNIFCSLYYNPQFSQYRFGSGKMAVLFKASAVAVILFSSVFVVYANKFFVKTRKKEIAIYSLLGMKKSQIGRMLFYENFFMGTLAIVGGVILGTVFSRFFSMILMSLMAKKMTISFSIQTGAIMATVVAFFILFALNSLNAYAIIYRFKLIELLSAGKEGEKAPKYSIPGGIISTIMIVIGYIIALTVDVNKGGLQLLLPAFIILVLVVTGTILLFQNFVPMVVVRLKKNEHLYFKPANYFSLSQIVYRIKANSRMLSIISVLSAATITIVSSTYSMYTAFESMWQKWLGFIIKQVLDNAVKYSQTGGSIRIFMEQREREAVLKIEDDGEGIREEDLKRVFDKSFTGYNGRKFVNATGIGLFLAQKLTRKLGHSITIESEFKHGTKVSLHFPKWNDYLSAE